jgi:hypothetical protein
LIDIKPAPVRHRHTRIQALAASAEAWLAIFTICAHDPGNARRSGPIAMRQTRGQLVPVAEILKGTPACLSSISTAASA